VSDPHGFDYESVRAGLPVTKVEKLRQDGTDPTIDSLSFSSKAQGRKRNRTRSNSVNLDRKPAHLPASREQSRRRGVAARRRRQCGAARAPSTSACIGAML
jgi:hypothetical protein